MNPTTQTQVDGFASLDTLRQVARMSNVLAKSLSGPTRTLAYRIKAEACSLLLLAGGATVNSVCPTGIVGLDLSGDPPFRLHVRRSHLNAQARALLESGSYRQDLDSSGERSGS